MQMRVWLVVIIATVITTTTIFSGISNHWIVLRQISTVGCGHNRNSRSIRRSSGQHCPRWTVVMKIWSLTRSTTLIVSQTGKCIQTYTNCNMSLIIWLVIQVYFFIHLNIEILRWNYLRKYVVIAYMNIYLVYILMIHLWYNCTQFRKIN